MEIKWYGTASIEIKSQSGKILFDPFVPLKGSKVDVKIEDFDGYDTIFVTHGHLDHIVNIPEIVKRNPNVKIYCTKTPYKTLNKKGVPEANLVKISAGEEIEIYDFKIKTYQSKHAVLPKLTLKLVHSFLHSPCSDNLPFLLKENKNCRENGEILFYQIEAEGKQISLMGSLNICDKLDYPTESDLLILPYNGWKDNLPPAIKVIEKLKPKKIFLDHYDNTFPPLTCDFDISPVLEKYKNAKPLKLKKSEII